MAAEQPPTTAQPTTADSPLPDPIIRTRRLIIRPMHPQDLTSMHTQASPPSITKYMTLAFAYPYTLTHAQTWISLNLTPPFKNYVICLASTPDAVIGGIGTKPGSDVESHVAEVGYWIGEEYWGQGIAGEALWAFNEWCLCVREVDGRKWTRLWAGVFGGNTASMKCLERAGYKVEGVMKGHIEKHGEVSDLHLFGLTKRDWEEWKKERGPE